MLFRPLKISDQQLINNYLQTSSYLQNYYASELTFINMYAWKNNDNIHLHINENYLILSCYYRNQQTFLPPLAKDETMFKKAMIDLEDYTIKARIDFIINGATKEICQLLTDEPNYHIHAQKDLDEYLYDPQKLITLSGKSLHSKRNHVNKFKTLYQYRFESYQKAFFEPILSLVNKWSDYKKTNYEKEAIINILLNLDALNGFCDCLFIENNLAGFAIGTITKQNIGLTLFEKADISYSGIYQALNQLTAQKHYQDVLYINRQEDMGIPELRKAKLSYKPLLFCEKYSIIKDQTIQDLIHLYMECFNDSKSYVDYFFQKKYKQENVFYIKQQNKIVSALHLIDKAIHYEGNQLDCPYIVAAGTLKAYRNKKLMANIISYTIQHLYNNNIIFCALNPFSNAYYEKFGFTTYTFYETHQIKAAYNALYEKVNLSNIHRILEVYQKAFTNYEGYIIRDLKVFTNLYYEMASDNFEYELIIHNNQDVGYLCHNHQAIEEIVLIDSQYLDYLQRFNNMEIKIRGTKPYNMIRLINPIKALEQYRFTKQGTFTFKIIDHFFNPNNLILKLTITDQVILEASTNYQLTITIEELTHLLFNGNTLNKQEPFYQLFKIKECYNIDCY